MKKRYKGILARPIAVPDGWSPGSTLLTTRNIKAYETVDAEINLRLEALFKHYDLEPQLAPGMSNQQINVWNLMIALAFAHVPGFQSAPARTGGRPSNFEESKFIFKEVERLRQQEPSLSVESACRHVQPTIRRKLGEGYPPKKISNRYYAFLRYYGWHRLSTEKQKSEFVQSLVKAFLETPTPPSS